MNGELPEQNGELGQQPEPRVSSQAEATVSPVGCVTDSQPEMESVDLATKNNQTELGTLNSREDRTVTSTHPKPSQENVISSSPGNTDTGNNTAAEDICAEDISEHRQDLDPSSKDEENLAEPTALMDHSPDDDTYRSRLRQRSVNEGGYIRLHKGMEKKLQKRKAIPKSAVQQV